MISRKPRQEKLQRRAVAAVGQVARQGVKEPQRGVGRVIEPLLLPFRKQVGNQAVADIVGERPQDVAGFDQSCP